MPKQVEFRDISLNTRGPNEVRINYTIENKTENDVQVDVGVWFNGNKIREFGIGGLPPGVYESTGYGVPITEGLNLNDGESAQIEVCVEVVDWETSRY